ncbi:hypothetical protein CJP46_09135 [Paenibacillus sp. XY044]|nr:hypothetical protein CJP46_09135 [Paenibacillus sp. XY044]
MATVQELKGNGVQRLLQFTGDEDFSVSGFKRLLLELLTAEEDGERGYADHLGGVQPLEGYRGHIQPASRPGLLGGSRVSATGVREADGGRRAVSSGTGSAVAAAANGRGHEPLSFVNGVRNPASGARAMRPAEVSEVGSVVHFHPARTKARETEGDRLRSMPLQQADRRGLERDSFPGVGGLQEAFDHWNRNQDREDASDSTEESESSGKTAGKTYIALGGSLCAAVIWRIIYMPNPTTSSLLISVLLTVLLGAAAWLGSTGKLKLGRSSHQAMEGGIPDFGSGEIDDDGHAPSRKRTPRFQVEQLTGWFGKGSRRKERDDDGYGKEDTEPDWKWKFSQDLLAASTGIELRGGGHGTSEAGLTAVGSGSKRSGTGIGREERETAAIREDYSDIRQRLWSHLEATNAAGVERADEDHVGMDGSIEYDSDSDLREGHAIFGTRQNNATVLLSVPMDGTAAGKNNRSGAPGYYLIREGEQGNPSERIELMLPHFVIGRSEEVAQYVEASTGTSRAHVELTRSKEGGYLIKDLGSRNGTKLHGEPMVPYKEYPLKDGDTFTIVSGVYTFKVS